MIGASQVVGMTSPVATVVDSLVLVARTTTASESFTISCQDVGVFDALIDWGDGSTSAITTYNDADLAHTFAVADDHTITITGSFPNLYFNNSASASKVIAAFLNGGQTFSAIDRGFYGCSLTSFDASGLTSITNCALAWHDNNLTSFDASGLANIIMAGYAWQRNSLTSFDASGFATMGIPANYCFVNAWIGDTNALDAASVESILTNIDASGRSAPAVGKDITIWSDGDPLTSAAATAVTSLKTKSWTITINGVAQ